ncbi:MAG: GPW/gp25 family protein [Caldilineaceae bacterium]|nr:GPW/gp25 family protein [Caldilineaceae bacterium]MBP8125651.1 GPW/gp25 family protein [Caldilineaceae bacterium]MBP9074963.1 GPW/gp25 family protein [Caldilineaceae bacterium]
MNERQEKAYLGKGLAFPLQINARGDIAMTAGEEDIRQAIRIILGTAPGERVMRPEFGCRIHELIFAPINATTEGVIVKYVEEALGQWEPRIAVGQVNVYPSPTQDGALLIEIFYQIKANHDERSIIYPFFLVDEESDVDYEYVRQLPGQPARLLGQNGR